MLLFSIAAFVLTAPIVLDVNSTDNRYELRMGGVIALRAMIVESRLALRLGILLWSFNLGPFRRKAAKPIEEKAAKPKKRWRPKLSASDVLRKARQLPAAFDLRFLDADIDTNDFALNALLVPAAYFGSGGSRRLRINFHGNVMVRMRLVTTGSRLAAALLT